MSRKFVRGGERARPQPGAIVEVRPYELHGTPYYAVLFRSRRTLRRRPGGAPLLRHDLRRPQPGDRVLIDAVLGVVDRIRRAEDV